MTVAVRAWLVVLGAVTWLAGVPTQGCIFHLAEDCMVQNTERAVCEESTFAGESRGLLEVRRQVTWAVVEGTAVDEDDEVYVGNAGRLGHLHGASCNHHERSRSS